MTNSSGDIGEPCGVPTWTGENVFGGSLEQQATGPLGEERANPGYHVVGNPCLFEG